MVDACRITKPTPGDPVWDDAQNTYTDPVPVVVYEGPCKIRNTYPNPQSVQSGGQQFGADIAIVSIPVAEAAGIEDGCEFELIESAHDPASVGLRATIMADHVQTYSTSCRFPVRAVTTNV